MRSDVVLKPSQVSKAIRDVRKAAGMTQAQLADKIGTTCSAISRMESADYHGHTVLMLHKVAVATKTRLEIVFVDKC